MLLFSFQKTRHGMNYKVLISSEAGFELANRSGYVIKDLRLLQLRSAYYSDADRYGISKEQCIDEWIEEEEIGEDSVRFKMKAPDMGADHFREEVARLLFPSAGISDENAGDIDHEVVEEGLSAFLNFIEPRHRQALDISSLLRASRRVEIPSTAQEINTATE